MATLNLIHLLHSGEQYKFTYSQLGKILKVNRMSVYRWLNASQISPTVEFRIKKAYAMWLSQAQKDFLSSYKT